jgi:uncharacterized protein YbjT (DUF2867 family)
VEKENRMILVTGATGTIGRALTSELRAQGVHVRAMTRDPERVTASPQPAGPEPGPEPGPQPGPTPGPTIELVRGDFTDPASLARALDGVDTLFLLAPPGPSVAAHDIAMMDAARTARLKKVVKLSAFGAEAPQPLMAASWHQPGERAVMESGLAWTVLRPAAFASNALGWVPVMRAGGALEIATGAGKHACVDPRDVAAVAARALTSPAHDGKAYTLTGPEPLSAREQVAILGRILGHSIEIEEVTPEITGERMRVAGLPAAFVDAAIEGLRFVRDGRAAMQSDAVEKVLGRAPRAFEQWARDHVSLFR